MNHTSMDLRYARETGRLHRSRSDRMVAGVAGGIAEHFGWDPTVIRALFVIAALAMGWGFLAYPVLWLLMPEGDDAQEIAAARLEAGEISGDEYREILDDLRRARSG